jgi:hypothetical protein
MPRASSAYSLEPGDEPRRRQHTSTLLLTRLQKAGAVVVEQEVEVGRESGARERRG